jgi:hypothetical protein
MLFFGTISITTSPPGEGEPMIAYHQQTLAIWRWCHQEHGTSAQYLQKQKSAIECITITHSRREWTFTPAIDFPVKTYVAFSPVTSFHLKDHSQA